VNYEFLKSLLTQAEAFERDTPAKDQQTLAGFTAWLGEQFRQTPEAAEPNGQEMIGVEIATFLVHLYRYTKLYSKKNLANTQLSTIDEFSYMVILIDGPAPTKTELIERNIHEKTTGIELLRRLIRGGLIEQFDDPTDRRSQRLKLTEQGRQTIFQILPRMDEVAKLVGGNLTGAEKKQLAFLLKKLHLFHNQIFMNERDVPIETLIERLIEEK